MNRAARAVTDEIAAIAERVDAGEIDALCARIASAGRIVLHGCGREGLQMRGLAMRLYQLGLDVGYQGEMTAPPLRTGDLFLASAGPGELSTVTALMRVARKAGATIALITAEPEAPTPRSADLVVTVPAQTMARETERPTSRLAMGSVYEGALFVLGEVIVLDLIERLGVDLAEMRARHTNME